MEEPIITTQEDSWNATGVTENRKSRKKALTVSLIILFLLLAALVVILFQTGKLSF